MITKYKIIPYTHTFRFTGSSSTHYKIKAKYRWFPFYITIKKEFYTVESAEKYLEQIKKDY